MRGRDDTGPAEQGLGTDRGLGLGQGRMPISGSGRNVHLPKMRASNSSRTRTALYTEELSQMRCTHDKTVTVDVKGD